jgi:sodium pump decarboxylase gamma subunit
MSDLVVKLSQGGILMLVGMAVVFLFLIVLIFFINGTAFIAKKLKWGEGDDEGAGNEDGGAPAQGDSNEVVAVIAAAQHHSAAN